MLLTVIATISSWVCCGNSQLILFINDIGNGVLKYLNFILSGIIEDLFSYRYPERKDNTPMKELPLKDGKHDHGIDALRYAIVNKFPIRQYEIRKYTIWL